MRLKKLVAALAASSLMIGSSSAIAAPAPAAEPVSAIYGDSQLGDSGLLGFLIVFGAGAAVGALLYSVLVGGDDDDEPASP